MSKQCLIYETLNSVKDVQTGRDENGFMTLTGVFGVCGVRNRNKRVYETSNYSSVLNEMKERIKADGGVPGELEHPQSMNTCLENISHKITDVNIDENGVVSGTIVLLNTPKGKIAQSIVEGGLPLFISSRATGQVDSKTGRVTLEKLATYDLVGTPGFEQARLHLNESQVCESLEDSQIYYITEKENQENNMENQELMEKLNALEERINTLEEQNETLRTQISENNQEIIQKISDGVQQWIEEEFAPEHTENLKQEIKEMMIEKVAPGVQQWIEEEFAPEHTDDMMQEIKEMMIEKIAPGIQQWVIEDFAPNIERWVVEEFAPGVQNWIIEEFAPSSEQWLKESLAKDFQQKIDESLAATRATRLQNIDDTLKILENMDVQKPKFGTKTMITEANANQPVYIQDMPDHVRPLYAQASDEVKESIARRAKLYNFANEGAVERFWEGIDFANIKPAAQVYEGLDLSQYADERERAIRAAFRRRRMAL